MVCAIRPASRTTGEDAVASASGDQGSHFSTCSAFSVGQISISPACPARWATCRIGAVEAVSPGVRAGSAKMASTAASSGSTARNDRFSGTRRNSKPALRGLARECLAHAGEHGGRRTLETVDRLLLVADGEQGADPFARAAAGEELLRQRRGSRPTARGSCPALRRRGCGRGRRRACRAPTPRPRRRRAGRRRSRSGPRNRARRCGPWRTCSGRARRCRAAAAPSSPRRPSVPCARCAGRRTSPARFARARRDRDRCPPLSSWRGPCAAPCP